jgi:hypothetical protein
MISIILPADVVADMEDGIKDIKEEKLDLSIPASCRNNTIVPKVMKPWYNLNTAQPKQRYDTISPVIDINR